MVFGYTICQIMGATAFDLLGGIVFCTVGVKRVGLYLGWICIHIDTTGRYDTDVYAKNRLLSSAVACFFFLDSDAICLGGSEAISSFFSALLGKYLCVCHAVDIDCVA